MTTKPAPARPRRNRALVIVDIVAGVIFGLVGLWYMFSFLVLQFTPAHAGLAIPFRIVTVVVWVASVAVFILFATRRRISFYWPIIGIVVMIAAGYLITSLAG